MAFRLGGGTLLFRQKEANLPGLGQVHALGDAATVGRTDAAARRVHRGRGAPERASSTTDPHRAPAGAARRVGAPGGGRSDVRAGHGGGDVRGGARGRFFNGLDLLDELDAEARDGRQGARPTLCAGLTSWCPTSVAACPSPGPAGQLVRGGARTGGALAAHSTGSAGSTSGPRSSSPPISPSASGPRCSATPR